MSLKTGSEGISGNYVLLRKKGSSIELEKSSENGSLDELLQQIPPSAPISVSLEGKGIIYKKIEDTEETTKNPLQFLLPDANEVDFYLFKYPSADGYFYAAAIRKSIIEDITEKFKSHGLFLIKLFLGPFAIYNILPSIRKENNLLKLSGYSIEISDYTIINIKHGEEFHDETIAVGKEAVPSCLLISFASAIDYFLDQKDELNTIPETEHFSREFNHKRLFNVIGFGFLGLVFIVLLINFLLFSNYRNTYNELNSELSSQKNLIERLDTLQNELKQRKEFIIEKGYLRSSRMSFYADRIAYSLPENIVLTKLTLHPLLGKIKMNKEINFNQNTITITGKASNSSLLNQWIKQLQNKYDWIKKIIIVNYTQEEYDSPGNFSIIISIG